MNFKCAIFKCLWFLSCPSLHLRLIMIWTERHGAIMYMWWDPPVSQAPPGCSLLSLSLSLAVSQPWSWASHDWRYVCIALCPVLSVWYVVFVNVFLFMHVCLIFVNVPVFECASICVPVCANLGECDWSAGYCAEGQSCVCEDCRLHCWHALSNCRAPLQISWVQDTSLT